MAKFENHYFSDLLFEILENKVYNFPVAICIGLSFLIHYSLRVKVMTKMPRDPKVNSGGLHKADEGTTHRLSLQSVYLMACSVLQ